MFILLKCFQKYLYLSSFKTTAFLLLLEYFFWSILCTLLKVVFGSSNKTFTGLHFWSTFYTSAGVLAVGSEVQILGGKNC